MKRKGKKAMWIVLVIVGVVIAGLGAGFLADMGDRRAIREMPIAVMDFHGLKDGAYVGEYSESKMRGAKVRVTVSGGRVTAIETLEGAVDKEGEPVALAKGLTVEDLFGSVIGAQSLQVDTISGATLTSKAHLKAVEDALMQAAR